MTDQADLTASQRFSFWTGRLRPGSFLGWAVAAVVLVLMLGAAYMLTGQPVTVIINDEPVEVRVHRLTVEAVLSKLELTLASEDLISPPADSPLNPNQTVIIKLARPAIIEVDSRTLTRLTQQQTVAGLLAEAKIELNNRDVVMVNGQVVAPGVALPPGASIPPATVSGLSLIKNAAAESIAASRPEPLYLSVHRAIAVTLNDNGLSSTIYTAQPTVGAALTEQGLLVYAEDKVTPALDTALLPGLHIYIQRSVPVVITVDGRLITTRTLGRNVEEVLAEEGIALMGQDYTRPELGEAISANQTIEVVRVRESLEIEQEFIPFETTWVADDKMALDRQEIRQRGVTGIIKTRTRVRTENGQEIQRVVEDKWLDQEPSDQVIAYGTQITVHTLETENGPIEYWRKISMLATPYSAASSGKSPDHARYGITRSGLPAGYGVVAVDPKVIPLWTDLYIPGYGQAIAGDTGGLIQGKRVDLGFDDDSQPLPDIYEWLDVYVLTPVPPADKIRYVLPDWPQQR